MYKNVRYFMFDLILSYVLYVNKGQPLMLQNMHFREKTNFPKNYIGV